MGMAKEWQYVPARPLGWDSQDLGGAMGCTQACTHRLVDVGSVISQDTENVCSSGSPEEKKQGFIFRLCLTACLGSWSGWDYRKHLQIFKIPTFPGWE